MYDLCHVYVATHDKSVDLFTFSGFELRMEPDNVKDKHAVAVWARNEDGPLRVGYVMKRFRSMAKEELLKSSQLILVGQFSNTVWWFALTN
jgi:hypothetical protein